MCHDSLQLKNTDLKIRTEGGTKERKNGVSVHAGCTALLLAEPLHPPPSPVAEKNVNSCMAGGQDCVYKGDKGEARTGAHFKCKAAAGSFVEFCAEEVRRAQRRGVRHKAGRGEPQQTKNS